MALIGLMLGWLCLIGCQILNNVQQRRTKKKIKDQCQKYARLLTDRKEENSSKEKENHSDFLHVPH